MLINTEKSRFAKVRPVAAGDVEWTGGFMRERFELCAQVTVPHIRSLFEEGENSLHVVGNFRIAAGEKEGRHRGTPYGDGDFYKWMEACMYVAAGKKDKGMFDMLDRYIALIGRAQQADGYISTKQIIGERNQTGATRMGDINDFEVYNFGHLFTAACLHHRLTGKKNFLGIALKAAEYLKSLYEEAERSGKAQTAVCPSHYMGLVELYRTTEDERWLKLAELAVRLRDSVENGTDDNQDRLPLAEHEAIVGHAVRSTYLYAGVADLYLENGDETLKKVLDRVWENCTEKKLYITGGCGALYNGVSPYGTFTGVEKTHQAFGYEYQLPNITAYNETCASIGNILWNYRMFAADPKAEYFDVIERCFYNLILASVSLGGNRYFYENMLRRTRTLDYKLIWPRTRKEVLGCFCCPPNMARTIAQSSEYAYMVEGNTVYTGLYGACQARLCLNGGEVTLIQETEYPWDGKIRFRFTQGEQKEGAAPWKESPILLMLRIPSFSRLGSIAVKRGGDECWRKELTAGDSGTYERIIVADPETETVELTLDMTPHLMIAHSKVEEAQNQAAVMRGPLVYCMEEPDVPGGDTDHIYLPAQASFEAESMELGGTTLTALKTKAVRIVREGMDENALYQPLGEMRCEETMVRLIPYFAWDNREFGRMRIWMPLFWGDIPTCSD